MTDTTAAGLSGELRAAAAPIWEAQHRHPFVRGIGDGTLDVERFGFWVRQDYLFLIEYSRVLALAAARAPDLDTMRRFADLTRATLDEEMDLHRSYCAEFGISAADLERTKMAPTTCGYTDFLLRTATIGDFGDLVAALLPCMWGFNEIGLRLAEQPPPADERYERWIGMYSSTEFTTLADWLRGVTDRIGADLPALPRGRMHTAFCASSRYELAFWDMAWTLQTWPSG